MIAASSGVTTTTPAPAIIETPPSSSTTTVAHAARWGAGTPIADRMAAKLSGPRASFA
jgi:hypothetical protein